VVFAVDRGRVLDHRAEIEAVRAEIKKSPEVLDVGDPLASGAPVSRDGKITFAQIQFRHGAGDVDVNQVKTMAENTLTLDGKGGTRWRSAATSSTGRRPSRAAPGRSSACSWPRSCCS
jgi:RND superfamily putative drug exporter